MFRACKCDPIHVRAEDHNAWALEEAKRIRLLMKDIPYGEMPSRLMGRLTLQNPPKKRAKK
jgi:hypothetical protein